MGNKPAAKFTQGSFTKRLAAHPAVAYHLYPPHDECKVWVPFITDQVLVATQAKLQGVQSELDKRAERIGSVFEGVDEVKPEDDVEIWQLRDANGHGEYPDVAEFVWSIRERLREQKQPEAWVAPNHVLIPAGDYHSCPFGPPYPARPRTAPQMGEPITKVAVIDSGWEDSGPASGLVVGHDYAEWLAPLPGGGYRWTPTAAAPEVIPPGSPGTGRLAALTAHANFIVGVVADGSPSAAIYVKSHNALFVEAAATDPGIPTEVAVARSLWEQRNNDLIHVGFAFPTLPDSPGDRWGAGPPSWALQVVLNALNAQENPPYIVAPAGNEGCIIPQYPAAFGKSKDYSNVIGVGSIDGVGNRSEFSNYGDWVRCCIEGEDVLSTFIDFVGETEEPELGGNTHPTKAFDGWATWSGTSFASPKITGALAARVAGGMTAERAWADLSSGASDAGVEMGLRIVLP
jgi:Subtilase family